ncbi:MAG: Uma2 family endonuclease [Tepidisphaerales bacterium]
MTTPLEKRRYTVQDYLTFERESPERHEYRDGAIFVMPGSSIVHSLIAANVIGQIGNRLRSKPCRVYDANLRLRIPRKVLYTYPDVTVICGPPMVDPDDSAGHTVTNPRLIVEVLSPSTEGYDRGEKFDRYRELETLQEYVLISQSAPRIEIFFRQQGGNWLFTPVSGLENAARLNSLEIELPLGDAYAGVEFPAETDGVVGERR